MDYLQLHRVSSREIAGVGYSPKHKLMSVAYYSDIKVYLYCGVKKEVYRDLLEATSKLEHLNKFIRNKYSVIALSRKVFGAVRK